MNRTTKAYQCKFLLLFCWTAEVFIFLKLAGHTHASWWWLVLFYMTDMGTVNTFRQLNHVDSDYKEAA